MAEEAKGFGLVPLREEASKEETLAKLEEDSKLRAEMIEEFAESEKRVFEAAVAEDDPKPPAHGLKMFEFKVLVKRDKAEEVTAGGVILPEQHIEKQEYAVNTGTLVAMSPLAFGYETWPQGARMPKIGDRVIFPKYAGADVKGKDGVEYRVLADKDIQAIVEE